jgi:hypothetical protein
MERERIFYVETASVLPSLMQYHQVTRLSYIREIRRKSSLQEVGYRLPWNVGTCLPNCTASYITGHFNTISSYSNGNGEGNHLTFCHCGCPVGRESYSTHSGCSPLLQQSDWCLDEYRWTYLVNKDKC